MEALLDTAEKQVKLTFLVSIAKNQRQEIMESMSLRT